MSLAVRPLVHLGYATAPAFLLIGAEKAGTTALFFYLGLHPQIVPSRKELYYFDDHYHRGLAWYHSQFPLPYRLRDGQVTFEATPQYLFWPRVPSRIYEYNSRIKLIAILRNPIERAFSAWSMPRLRKQRGLRSFEEMARDEMERLEAGTAAELPNDFHFVERGLYAVQLMRYFALFPREQVLVVENGAMRRDTVGTLEQITAFLGLHDFQWETEPRIFEPLNVGEYAFAASIQPEMRARLADFYRPHNQKLYDLLGVDYGWT